MPLGGLISALATFRSSVDGKRNDRDTPTREAQNVPNIYRMMTGFMLASPSDFFCAMAFMTRKKTRIGATPFSARTKRSPKIVTAGTADGTNRASRMPMTRPTAICLMRAIRFSAFFMLVNTTHSPFYIELIFPWVMYIVYPAGKLYSSRELF